MDSTQLIIGSDQEASLTGLTQWKGSPRPMPTDEELAPLMESIKLGIFKEILVELETKHVIDGRKRLAAYRLLGLTHAPVTWLRTMTKEEKLRVALTANGHTGGWDMKKMKRRIAKLPPETLSMIGFERFRTLALGPMDHPVDPHQKWKSMNIKMAAESYDKTLAMLDKFCEEWACEPGTALERILEDWSQTLGNSPYDI